MYEPDSLGLNEVTTVLRGKRYCMDIQGERCIVVTIKRYSETFFFFLSVMEEIQDATEILKKLNT